MCSNFIGVKFALSFNHFKGCVFLLSVAANLREGTVLMIIYTILVKLDNLKCIALLKQYVVAVLFLTFSSL